MRPLEIHAGVERMLGRPVRWASVKGILSAYTLGGDQRFRRCRRGLYGLASWALARELSSGAKPFVAAAATSPQDPATTCRPGDGAYASDVKLRARGTRRVIARSRPAEPALPAGFAPTKGSVAASQSRLPARSRAVKEHGLKPVTVRAARRRARSSHE